MFNRTNNFIKIYDNALSSGQCKELTEWIDEKKLNRGLLGTPSKVDLNRKDDWEVDGSITNFKYNHIATQYLSQCLQRYVPKYKKEFKEINGISEWRLYERYNLQKYLPGGGFHILHCEDDAPSRNRVLVWSVYLNTVTDRGGTYFSSFNKTVQAKEGRLVMFPPYWTHHHKGVMSKTQTKYIATGWFTYLGEELEEEKSKWRELEKGNHEKTTTS